MNESRPLLNDQQREWLQSVDQYILKNLESHHLVISDIADAVCMSERQFYRKIEDLTGQTPNHYIQSWRMRRARQLLESGQCDTVKEVALSVGFHNPDYFSRLFETFYGYRPADYLGVD